jgi:hypothetical protein
MSVIVTRRGASALKRRSLWAMIPLASDLLLSAVIRPRPVGRLLIPCVISAASPQPEEPFALPAFRWLITYKHKLRLTDDYK